MTRRWTFGAACLVAGLPSLVGSAEEAPARELAQVTVQITLTKTAANGKTDRLAYTLPCTEGRKASVRMGVEVPILVTPAEKGARSVFQYRNVGSNLECQASGLSDDRFRLELYLELSSLSNTDGLAPSTAPGTSRARTTDEAPAFRSSNAKFNVVLRHGEKQQVLVATHPLGDVVTVDLALTVPESR